MYLHFVDKLLHFPFVVFLSDINEADVKDTFQVYSYIGMSSAVFQDSTFPTPGGVCVCVGKMYRIHHFPFSRGAFSF